MLGFFCGLCFFFFNSFVFNFDAPLREIGIDDPDEYVPPIEDIEGEGEEEREGEGKNTESLTEPDGPETETTTTDTIGNGNVQ